MGVKFLIYVDFSRFGLISMASLSLGAKCDKRQGLKPYNDLATVLHFLGQFQNQGLEAAMVCPWRRTSPGNSLNAFTFPTTEHTYVHISKSILILQDAHFFVQIRYYDTSGDCRCKGTIELSDVIEVSECPPVPNAPKKASETCFFELKTSRRTFVFCADTKQSAQEWISKIQFQFQ